MFLHCLSVILFTGAGGCHDVTSCYGQHHPEDGTPKDHNEINYEGWHSPENSTPLRVTPLRTASPSGGHLPKDGNPLKTAPLRTAHSPPPQELRHPRAGKTVIFTRNLSSIKLISRFGLIVRMLIQKLPIVHS